MDKKTAITVICSAVAICAVTTLVLVPKHHKVSHSINNKPTNEFVVDGGPMMPPSPFAGPNAQGVGPKPMAGHPDMIKQLHLTDEQHAKLRNLDEKLHKNIRALRSEEEELRDAYLEKMDAVLTSEQFRKIQNMRQNLRKEMKKLQNKRDDIMENHRQSFESILTPEQRKMLWHSNNEHDINRDQKQESSTNKHGFDAKQKPDSDKPKK